jgi:hypothetical protein
MDQDEFMITMQKHFAGMSMAALLAVVDVASAALINKYVELDIDKLETGVIVK